MAERDDALAITPDPAFHDRLRDQLEARLAAARVDAAAGGAEPEVVVVDIDGAPRRHRRGRVVLATAAAAVLAVVVGVVAVSRGGTPDPLGPNRPATGAPVTVGFLTEDPSGPDARAARAAARYVNEHLGGIRGRPLELDVCSMGPPVSASQPEAAACADRFVAAKLPAVLHGYSLGVATPEGILTNFGVPVITDKGAGLDGGGQGAGTYGLGNVDVIAATQAALAANEGARKVVVAVAIADVKDDDATMFGLEAGFRPFFERAGVDLSFTADTVRSPDQLRAALADAGQVQILAEESSCAAALTAVRDAGFTGPVSFAFNCATPATASAAGGLMAGTRLLDERVPTGTDAGAVRYRAVVAEYDPDLDSSLLLAASGYRAVLAFAEVMGSDPGDVSVEAVRTAFETMDASPLPLSLGQTFKCDGRQVRDKVRICSRAGAVQTLDAAGKVTSSKVVDLTTILAP